MTCILHPECIFPHSCFRCQLPMETVGVEGKVKTMQGIHTLRRDRTSQVIKCNLWSTRLCPYPSLVQKMRTYLELEGRLGPKSQTQTQTQLQPTQSQQVHMQQSQERLAQPSTNPRVRKSPAPKVNDKIRKTVLAKRRYKVRLLTQPMPSTPTSTAPTPMVVTVSTQTPMVRSTAQSIPVTINKLATGQFADILHPTTRSINDNPSPLEDIPSAQCRFSIRDLFKTRKDWSIPLNPVPTPTPPSKQKNNPKLQQSPMPGQCSNKSQKMLMGTTLPHLQKQKEHREEDWDGDLQNQPRMCPQILQPEIAQNPHPQNLQHPQPQTLQHPPPQSSQHAEKQNFQHPQLQNNQKSFEVPERYYKEIRLDCFSSSELDSESDEEEKYKYEHKYETLV